MSFGINGPERRPAIEKPQNMMNNGGGGNLGYFRQEKKEKEDKNEQDILELSNKEESEEELEKFQDYESTVNSIGTKIKNFWFKIHDITNENKEETDSEKK